MPADFARYIADAMAKEQFVIKPTGDEFVINAKKMTPRGKLSVLIQIANRRGGMVAQCQRLKVNCVKVSSNLHFSPPVSFYFIFLHFLILPT